MEILKIFMIDRMLSCKSRVKIGKMLRNSMDRVLNAPLSRRSTLPLRLFAKVTHREVTRTCKNAMIGSTNKIERRMKL